MTQTKENIPSPSLYCYIKHYTHLHFFEQLLAKTYPELPPRYFTDNISLYLYIKLFRKATVRLTPILFLKKKKVILHLSEKTLKILNWEVAYMQKSEEQVSRKYQALLNWYSDQMEMQGISFCWSGNNTESHAFVQAATNKNHLTYCGEITNYPQTVYLDQQGTNYFSKLVNKIAQSGKTTPIGSEAIEKLKALKTGQKHIPQASLKKKVQIFIALYGIQQFLLSAGNRFSIWHVLVNKFKSFESHYSKLVKNDEFIKIEDWTPGASKGSQTIKILAPLQINHDTQLHVFSNFKSSFDYIKFLLSIIDDQVELHIKLHPAEKKETNQLTTYLVNKLSAKHPNIKLISTFEFADYDAVATINSTFGIDALLSNCKVITFGQSLYSDFNFVLHYGRHNLASLRAAIEAYDQLVNPESFDHFATTIQQEFYNFNYFGGAIDQGVSTENLTRSINRLQADMDSL
jgi:capsule polysaccharide modification protein KpsS